MHSAPTSPTPAIPPVQPNGAAPPPPPPAGGRFAQIPRSEPVDLADRAKRLADVPKQEYGGQDAPPVAGAPEGTPMVGMSANTKRKGARALLRVLDRLQSNVFAVVAKNDDPELFRFTTLEFEDLSKDLEDGVEQMNFQIPWWIGFLIGLALIMWVNWTKASKIRDEKLAQERAAAKARAEQNGGAAQAGAPPTMPKGTVVKLKDAQAARRAEPKEVHKCLREGCNNLIPLQMKFCSRKCNGLHHGQEKRIAKANAQHAAAEANERANATV